MDENLLEQLQILLDRKAIEDQILHYSHLVDEKQFENLYDVMVPNAWIDYTASGGIKGSVEDMKQYLSKSMAMFRSQHLMTNIESTIAPDRKTAKSTHILFNPMTMTLKGQDHTFFCGLWYDCDWVRCEDGVWRIEKMIQRGSYTHNAPFPIKTS